jgi:glycosyltransferase involved in cell wall biosynthesis
MREPFFSVIVPAHNSARYIWKGLKSIVQQSFEDYELIIVCDACTDDTHRIAFNYADNLIVTEHGMDGLARNAGIDAANGEWILFMDDDDWFLHPYVFQILHEEAVMTDADMIVFNFIWQKHRPDGGDQYYRNGGGRTNSAVWSKCWRRSFIGDTRFHGIPFTSDEPFMNAIIEKRPRAVWLDQPMYFYNYMREGSQTEEHSRKNGGD